MVEPTSPSGVRRTIIFGSYKVAEVKASSSLESAPTFQSHPFLCDERFGDAAIETNLRFGRCVVNFIAASSRCDRIREIYSTARESCLEPEILLPENLLPLTRKPTDSKRPNCFPSASRATMTEQQN